MTEVVWSSEALRDLEAIRDYIARDSAAYADLVVRRIVAAVERLRVFPESGRVVPERSDPSIREVIVRPYRVVYRLHDSTVPDRHGFPRVTALHSADRGLRHVTSTNGSRRDGHAPS